MPQAKSRSSNMELLRIVSMLMIVFYHVFCHSIGPALVGGTELFPYLSEPVFSPRLALLSLIYFLGPTANGCFILISGYFLGPREAGTIDIGKTARNLLCQLLTATVVLSVFSYVARLCFQNDCIPAVTDLAFQQSSWFVGYYFLIAVCAKLFLNRYLQNLEQRRFAAFLLTIFAISQFNWSAELIRNISTNLSMFVTGIFLYGLGFYIRKYAPFDRLKTGTVLIVLLAIGGAILLSVYNMTQADIQASALNGTAFTHPIRTFSSTWLLPIAAAVALFELFRRIPVFHSKWVNFLGKATLMVYLFHDNSLFYSLWDRYDWNPLFYYKPVSFLLVVMKLVLTAFFSGVAVYAVFLGAGWLLKKLRPLFLRKEQRNA